jgi:copper homeostasis protein
MPAPSSTPFRDLRLEVVTDTVAGVRAAVDGGADRIELVGALSVGGITPSRGLMQAAAGCGLPVRAMIRPRAGDFTYSAGEIDLMRRDIDAARTAGLAGVVFGANHAAGPLDATVLEILVRHSAGLEVAIHRSFDLAPDPLEAIETCVSLGLVTILTSGGPRHAADGIDGLALYVAQARGRIDIMAGSGVTAANAAAIVAGSGVHWLHASCSAALAAGVQPPADRVAALGGLTAGRTETIKDAVCGLRGVLDQLASGASPSRLRMTQS